MHRHGTGLQFSQILKGSSTVLGRIIIGIRARLTLITHHHVNQSL
jgi:hypothetical protein